MERVRAEDNTDSGLTFRAILRAPWLPFGCRSALASSEHRWTTMDVLYVQLLVFTPLFNDSQNDVDCLGQQNL